MTTTGVLDRARAWLGGAVGSLLIISSLAPTAAAQQPDVAGVMGEQLRELQAHNREQAERIAQQQQAIAALSASLDALSRRLEQLEHQPSRAAPAPPAAAEAAPPQTARAPEPQRDGVGDLNAASVAAGSFAGSILLPGTKGVSLAMGGFVKAVAIGDSGAEALGSDMLPATLGTSRPDTDGNFAIDSTITRLHMDGRAHTDAGDVRGYVEYDLNATNNGALGFKLRHAYGTWSTGAGTLTGGQTWSTMMDLRILPEGLTEPTISGAIFQRQAQLRWSFPAWGPVNAHLAVEDPNGADIFTGQTSSLRTTVPDFTAALQLTRPRFHLRVGGVARQLDLEDPASGARSTATGWGTALSGRVALSGRDNLAGALAFGDGVGRYLLGLSGASGGALAPEGGVRRRQGLGGLAWYQHSWTSSLRSTIGVGHAVAEVFGDEPGTSFRNSTYAYENLMWSAMRYASFGAEYSFGRRARQDGTRLDNHRVMLGLQVF